MDLGLPGRSLAKVWQCKLWMGQRFLIVCYTHRILREGPFSYFSMTSMPWLGWNFSIVLMSQNSYVIYPLWWSLRLVISLAPLSPLPRPLGSCLISSYLILFFSFFSKFAASIEVNPPSRNWQTLKGRRVNSLHSRTCALSCNYSARLQQSASSYRPYINEWMWLCSNQMLSMDTEFYIISCVMKHNSSFDFFSH